MHIRVAESIRASSPPAGVRVARLSRQAANGPVSQAARNGRSPGAQAARRQSPDERSMALSGQRQATEVG
ncbi:MAG: hypothetical protein AW07_03072 [Candidatus Accumulibacter sp. SK-11]|nr:MAG: hypothetical protein AW07_03072 [Candidatus Accumulibacter sp. SK-11]